MSRTVWEYVGNWDAVGPCRHLNNSKIPGIYACNNGSCPGEIAGKCLFCAGEPIDGYHHLFRVRRIVP